MVHQPRMCFGDEEWFSGAPVGIVTPVSQANSAFDCMSDAPAASDGPGLPELPFVMQALYWCQFAGTYWLTEV